MMPAGYLERTRSRAASTTKAKPILEFITRHLAVSGARQIDPLYWQIKPSRFIKNHETTGIRWQIYGQFRELA
jgi:hypothetical protein